MHGGSTWRGSVAWERNVASEKRKRNINATSGDEND